MSPHSTRLEAELAHGKHIRETHPDIWCWATPAGRARAERRAALLVAHGMLGESQRVLELGCGTGMFTSLVSSATRAAITGVDVSAELLAEARERVPAARFVSGDAHHLPFPDGRFDAVYGSSVLHHLVIDDALEEIRRVLAPGGRIVFAEPNMLNPQIAVQKNVPPIKRWLGDVPHETAYVRWSIAATLRRHGFVDVIAFPYDFLHPLVPAPLMGVVSALGRAAERTPLVREIAGSLVLAARRPA